ncbi:hypothetical protein CQK02_21115 [Salmonella enterica]|nr:hypothetical protein [Salmonella enterica]EAV1936633.1 hypothetical protein [Salmonella enterica]EBE6145504.1 hypothetical protein [Salmonella enterica]EIK7651524.1 hypothetical protein [Salmonella enterica]EKH8225452.1 hypothetical protein [Salmonella enterica]
MAKLLNSTYLWFKNLSTNKKTKLIATFLLGGAVCVQVGEQIKFHSLSKDPNAALIDLIYEKCLSNVNVTEEIKFYTCLSEEFSHIRNTSFKTEMFFKTGKYIHECKIKKEDKSKCLSDIASLDRKRLEKYHEIEKLMN